RREQREYDQQQSLHHRALLCLSPTQNHVRGGGEKTMAAGERPRLVVVVVAQLRAKNNVPARPKRNTRRQRRGQAGEAGALSLDVVKKLQPRRAAQPRREVVRQIVENAEPVRRADIRHVGLEAEQTLEVVVEAGVELLCVDQVEDLRIVEALSLIEAA